MKFFPHFNFIFSQNMNISKTERINLNDEIDHNKSPKQER
jgi:hypothetical protein